MKKISILILLFGFIVVSSASADYPPNPQDCCVYCPNDEQELCLWNDSNFLYVSIDPDSAGDFCANVIVIQDGLQYEPYSYDVNDNFVCGDIYIYTETRLAYNRYASGSPFDPTSPMTLILENCIDYKDNVSLEYPSGCGVVATTTIPITTTTSTIQIATTTTTIGTSDAVIVNHMMTKKLNQDHSCYEPISTDTFYDDDVRAYCWFYWENASPTDEIGVYWYKPDGEYYKGQLTSAIYAEACWYPYINIFGETPETTLGDWRVAVYFNGVYKSAKYFTIISSASTSTIIIPTTTISETSTTTPIITTSVNACEYGSCQTTAECTAGYGLGWACVNGCCESTGADCPISSALEDDEAQLDAIRDFRDNVLNQTPEGREIIRLYYEWSPAITRVMEVDEGFRLQVKEMIDGILELSEGGVE